MENWLQEYYCYVWSVYGADEEESLGLGLDFQVEKWDKYKHYHNLLKKNKKSFFPSFPLLPRTPGPRSKRRGEETEVDSN